MYNTEQWPAFQHTAHEQLLKGQRVDDYKPSIQLAVEPSFANSFFLQLVIDGDTVLWRRTMWLRELDARKFSDPVEGLKHFDKPAIPTIEKESGAITKTDIQPIVDAINTLAIAPVLENPGFVLDGTYYTLTIGSRDVQACYKWHHLPGGWGDLQRLAGMIEALNEKLTASW